MNVASLDHCKELYELSGWDGDDEQWTGPDPYSEHMDEWFPVYHLGYLMRKLPRLLKDSNYRVQYLTLSTRSAYDFKYYGDKGAWWARYGKYLSTTADTPEDAVCELAIELFKQKILTKENQ